METINGTILEIIFHNEENGYTIFNMDYLGEFITAVGNMAYPHPGLYYKLTGEYKTHPKYGMQFVFTDSREILPADTLGMEKFLSSGIVKGVRKKTAISIVNRFKEKTFDILENNPDKLCEISGIGEKKAKIISESYKEHREFADISIFFQNYGISPNQAFKLYKSYGKDAIPLIKENPYRLTTEIYGYGFKKADQLASKLGIPSDSPFRIESAIKYGLHYYVNDGNTYVPQDILCENVAQLLDLTREKIYEILISMALNGDIKIEDVNGEKAVYLYSFYVAEQKICRNLLKINNATLKPLFTDIEKSISITEEKTGIILSEGQKNAVKSSISSGISIITGGPGTGKTTIINTIINLFLDNDFDVAIAAPTGRAAKRISETSGHFASTIHRLLEYYYSDGIKDMAFGRNEENPLEYDVIIVDETSMIDLLLMEGLTNAILPGTRLILVGDSDQLPSVGPGNILRDMIYSGFISTSNLSEIYRQSKESKIIINAHRVNHGEYPYLNGKDSDFFFMERDKETSMVQLIVELITKRLPEYYDVHPLDDIQVISPTKRGKVGTLELNNILQSSCNPPSSKLSEKKYGNVVFREGDKVMQIKNNYQLKWFVPKDGSKGSGIFNGDMGYVVDIDNEEGTITVLYDGEKYVDYDFTQLDELELAYAITVHKSQGSEFPIVIMPISWFPPMLATRNLLYTGITRGKKTVVLVGSQKSLYAMVDNDRIKLRYCGLANRLTNLIEFQ